MTRRSGRILATVAIIAAILLLPLAGLALLLAGDGLRPLAERVGSHLLERRLEIGALDVGTGESRTGTVSLDIRDFRLANAPAHVAAGDAAVMARFDRLRAEIELAPLLRGELRYRRLRIERPVVILERDAAGTGNWRFGAADGSGDGSDANLSGGLALLPKDRTQFPDLLDFVLDGGLVTYRTRSGNILRIGMERLAIRSEGSDSPVSLELAGAYNGLPARLQAETASFATLRDAARDFDVRYSITTADAELGFDGIINRPLDYDAVQGRLSLDSRRAAPLLQAVFGSESPIVWPFDIIGAFSRNGDSWMLDAARGRLAGNAFTGELMLQEGRRMADGGIGRDAIDIVLDFPRLDLMALRQGMSDGGGEDGGGDRIGRRPDDAPDIEVKIGAGQVDHGRLRFADARLSARLDGPEITVGQLRAGFAGGSVSASGSLSPAGGNDGQTGDGQASRMQVRADAANVDAAELARLLGGAAEQVAGKLQARIDLAMTGRRWSQLPAAGRGHAVLDMRDGGIARSLLEAASADLRSLFRKDDRMAPVDCLLAVAELRDGRGRIAPLRLRSRAAVIAGSGSIDLAKRSLDLVIQADADSTGFFALDIPIRIQGRFDDISAGPAGTAARGDARLPPLPPALLALANDNPCRV